MGIAAQLFLKITGARRQPVFLSASQTRRSGRAAIFFITPDGGRRLEPAFSDGKPLRSGRLLNSSNHSSAQGSDRPTLKPGRADRDARASAGVPSPELCIGAGTMGVDIGAPQRACQGCVRSEPMVVSLSV